MVALVAALSTFGLVWLAATRTGRRRAAKERELARLSRIPAEKLTREQAEDGAVLARKFRDAREEARFKTAAQKLKRST